MQEVRNGGVKIPSARHVLRNIGASPQIQRVLSMCHRNMKRSQLLEIVSVLREDIREDIIDMVKKRRY